MKWRNCWLHLGLGRFHRAHQAVYFQRLAESGGPALGGSAYAMTNAQTSDDLRARNFRYPVLEVGARSQHLIWVEAIRECGCLTNELESFSKMLATPEVGFLTTTITEKGYCLDNQGNLDFNHPAIAQDLKTPNSPRSAIGVLALGLSRREQLKGGALTIVSCDNLAENGLKLERAISAYFWHLRWTSADRFLKNSVSFPCSVVDRIVPAVSPATQMNLEKKWQAPGVIQCEEFSQWVIEDRFAGERPPLDQVGVQFVSDVNGYTQLKLRILNAAHSFLAYAGLLKGYEFVHQAVQDPDLAAQLRNLLLSEVAPTFEGLSRSEVESYSESVMARFANQELAHRLTQIAMDGSLKIPQRILPSIQAALKRGSPRRVLISTLDSWFQFLHQELLNGKSIQDPMAGRFAELFDRNLQVWRELLSSDETLMGELARNSEFKKYF